MKKGNKSVRRAAHVKICEPVDRVVAQLPPQSVYEQYGRSSKLLIHPKDVPKIPLELFSGRPEMENVDTSDDSKNREKSGVRCNEQLEGNSDVIVLTDSRRTTNDTLDESRDREQCNVHADTSDTSPEVNLVTEVIDPEIILNDESRSRYGVKVLEEDGCRVKTTVAGLQAQEEVEVIDESSIRETVTVVTLDDCIDKSINRDIQIRNIRSDDSDEASRRVKGTASIVVCDNGDESNGQTLRISCTDDGVSDKSRGRFAGTEEDFKGKSAHSYWCG